ncbi:hypothetical protein CH352_15210 [Leptospira hartskeerlii]|uniref:Inverse autotransporter beta-domain domain-containing protein n=1 Tax=Leptospira hartskeerlii TaxID=2023177 RepID=A0A2M9XCD4_9LEPT|nr:hypothetical protein [Leptospira hartskeerlii]PJZ25343.1 hypothetical protein CH357_10475 [Leptospira hartskeerlii]PJZ32677.1 hypothetical protein CH352_15210 [Leptospira hartskeerlii]
MRFLYLVFLLLPTAFVFGSDRNIPAEVWFRPWWKDREISFFGILEKEEVPLSGISLQLPVSFDPKEEYRLSYVRTSRNKEGKFFETVSLGYQVALTHDIGLRFRFGAGGYEPSSYFTSLGLYNSNLSWDLFGRKNEEENSLGILLNSSRDSEFRIGLGFERIRSSHLDPEDRISIAVYGNWEGLLGQVEGFESENDPIEFVGFGYSPFYKKEESLRSTVVSKAPVERTNIYPSLEPEELLKLGFSLQESISISSFSKGQAEKFETYIGSFPDLKRRKIERLIRTKRGF